MFRFGVQCFGALYNLRTEKAVRIARLASRGTIELSKTSSTPWASSEPTTQVGGIALGAGLGSSRVHDPDRTWLSAGDGAEVRTWPPGPA